MMKKGLLVVAAAMIAMGLHAQAVQETSAIVGTLTVPACTVSFEKDAKLVQDAMNQRFKDMKLKTKKSEGYIAALEQVCAEIHPTSLNVYTKVEEQGKKKERVAVLTICAISNDLTIDQMTLRAGVRQFAESMISYVNRYEAQQHLETQQGNLKKAEKAAAAATAVVTGLDKDINSAQKKIADKKAEIEKLKGKIKDLEKEIKDLENDIQTNTGKKSEAEQKSAEAQQNVKDVEKEVDRYRQQVK